MAIYRYLTNGRIHYRELLNLEEAIQQAARDHNRGAIVDEIMDRDRRYNRQEILTICNDMGLLR